MKYMTPELLARFRSDDDAISEAASLEWEKAAVSYDLYINQIKEKLPTSIRRLLRQPCLHDAKVLTLICDERLSLSFFLQLDVPSKRIIELKYRLVCSPQFVEKKPAPRDGKPYQWWLYDEIELIQEKDIPLFKHSILLTGGVEIVLTFFALHYRRIERVLVPANEQQESPERAAALLE